ncbi:hypothetical protein BDV96DRAFT_577057 [Lophiotrema nucula]|uniref:Uncharacterized protein n=1 Tax=Lophiotrema nucula TaxID=690887 RepID=A0A6A5Z545_9PLEO|nr:hypothetical protein BDV96DRAFT_577057 [Lophiotrema nucula]
MGLSKTLGAAKNEVLRKWTKLARPTVTRGATAWPKTSTEQEKFGIRLDYDGTVTQNGVSYHKFQVQPNAGKIPTSISTWMKKNGSSTHAVMADVLVKDGATENEVEEAVENAFEDIEI